MRNPLFLLACALLIFGVQTVSGQVKTTTVDPAALQEGTTYYKCFVDKAQVTAIDSGLKKKYGKDAYFRVFTSQIITAFRKQSGHPLRAELSRFYIEIKMRYSHYTVEMKLSFHNAENSGVLGADGRISGTHFREIVQGYKFDHRAFVPKEKQKQPLGKSSQTTWTIGRSAAGDYLFTPATAAPPYWPNLRFYLIRDK